MFNRILCIAAAVLVLSVAALAQATAQDHMIRGNSLFSQKQYKEALAAFSKAIELDPKLADAYLARGRARYVTQDPDGAIADATKGIELRGGKGTLDHYLRGVYKQSIDDDEGALADYDRALALDARATNAYIGRGEIKYKLKNYDGAIADFSTYLGFDPKHVGTLTSRAFARIGKKDYAGALTDTSAAVTLEPKNSAVYQDRAFVKAVMKDYVGAAADYTTALQLDPSQDRIFRLRGDAYRRAGNVALAVADLKKAIGDGPPESVTATMKFDEFGGFSDEALEDRLLDVGIAMLTRYRNEQLYVFAYGGRVGYKTDGKELAAKAAGVMASLGIPKTKVVAIDGGFKDDRSIELYIVPKGGSQPYASPSVDPSEVTPPTTKP